MTNSKTEYNEFIRANLPQGITYNSDTNRYVVNEKPWVTFNQSEWYLEYISKFGFSASTPTQDLLNALLVDATQLIAHPLEYGSMFQDRAGTTPVTAPGQLVGHVLDAGGGGYHATAISDAARGVYAVVPETGRRNRIKYSEPTDAQLAAGSLIDAAAFGDFDRSLQFTATATTNIGYVASDTDAGISATLSVFVIMDDGLAPSFGSSSVANVANDFALNLRNTVLDPTTYTVTDIGSGIYRVSGTGITGTNASNTGVIRYNSNSARGFRVAGFQIEYGGLSAYQKTNDYFDVTEAGVPSLPYLSYNGVNTAYSTPALPAPLVDKSQVFAGVRKLSDASAAALLNFAAGSDGSVEILAPLNSVSTYRLGSQGTIERTVAATGLPAPTTNVLTGLGDISGDLVALRVDGTQVAQSTADQGTGNYNPAGTYPLYYGARAGTSLFFNGRSYATLGPIVRFSPANATAAQIEAAEAYYTARVI